MYLVKDGKAGYAPEEYLLFRAARYVGVAPWELEQQSVYWLNHALKYESIENEAQRMRHERAQRRHGARERGAKDGDRSREINGARRF